MDATTDAAGKTAGAGATPPDGTGKSDTPTDPKPGAAITTPAASTPRTFTQDELNSLLAEERRKTKQSLLDDAETKIKTEQGQFKDLLDKEKQTHQATQERLRAERVQNAAFRLTATNKVAIRADRIDYALRLVDSAALKFDDSGNPTNLEDLLTKLLKDIPELGSQAAPANNGGPTNPAKGTPLTREAIEAMTPDQIAARWPEIEAFMKTQK
jgi:hypothetical protein